MFTPGTFRIDNADQLAAFMQRYSFCTLITPDAEDLSISHVPVLVDRNADQFVLTGHLAAANPHGPNLEGRRSTAIFHGPHSYVSPGWYENTKEVPTWNYASVHATGMTRTFNDTPALSALVERMIDKYESQHDAPWDRQLPDDYRDQQLSHIVGFEMVVDKIQGKYKLGQNRSQSDQDKMLSQLEASPHDDSRALAKFIKQYRQLD